ncbi:MAG: hypothetical protein KKG99_00210 [Bacteroidetes bacterium]|nr:hypothetical protein [Bacteroidota bacterium]
MQTHKNFSWVFILIPALVFLSANALMAQEKKENNPKIEIKVNKEKDDKGNVIRFDSTYSYSWHGENMSQELMDSIFNEFKMNGHLKDFFKNDIFGNDFFDHDFLSHRDSILSGFDFGDFFNDDFFENRSDSLSPRIYDHFGTFPFLGNSGFEKMQEMMKQHQEEMMEYFEQFRNSRDSIILKKPEIRKQNNTTPVSKGNVIKT